MLPISNLRTMPLYFCDAAGEQVEYLKTDFMFEVQSVLEINFSKCEIMGWECDAERGTGCKVGRDGGWKG